MQALALIGGALAIVTGVGGFGTAVYVFARVHGMEATITVLDGANEALRAANGDADLRALAIRDDFQSRLHTQEVDCQRQISELQGQITALTGGLARELIVAVVGAMQTTTATTTTVKPIIELKETP